MLGRLSDGVPTLRTSPRLSTYNRRRFEQAAELGAEVIVTLTGGLDPDDPDFDAARKRALDGLAQLLPDARDAGVTLALEPLHPMVCGLRSVLSTLGDANDWLDQLDANDVLGLTIDSYALWWDPALEQQITRAGDRLASFHVSDWLPETRDVRLDRGMPGDGLIDNRKIRGWIERTGFGGLIEVEIFFVTRLVATRSRMTSSKRSRNATRRCSRLLMHRGAASSGPPVEEALFQKADSGADQDTEKRQDHDAGEQALEIVERAGFQDIGADAVFGTQHLGGDEEDDGNRQADPKAGEDARHGTWEHDLTHDRKPGESEALPHADQRTIDIVDGAEGCDHRRCEGAKRDQRVFRALINAEPDHEEREERDLGDREDRCDQWGEPGTDKGKKRDHTPVAIPMLTPMAAPTIRRVSEGTRCLKRSPDW